MTQPPRDALLRYELRVAGRDYREDLDEQAIFGLDPAGLNRALAENPGMYAHWATLEVLAKAEVDELEEQLEVLEGQLTAQYEVSLKTDKVTLVRQAVKCDAKRVKLTGRVRAARETLGLIRVGVVTLDKRLDAIFEAARNMRAEMAMSGRKKVSTLADAESEAEKVFG